MLFTFASLTPRIFGLGHQNRCRRPLPFPYSILQCHLLGRMAALGGLVDHRWRRK